MPRDRDQAEPRVPLLLASSDEVRSAARTRHYNATMADIRLMLDYTRERGLVLPAPLAAKVSRLLADPSERVSTDPPPPQGVPAPTREPTNPELARAAE